jgi:hypothetical protein
MHDCFEFGEYVEVYGIAVRGSTLNDVLLSVLYSILIPYTDIEG